MILLLLEKLLYTETFKESQYLGRHTNNILRKTFYLIIIIFFSGLISVSSHNFGIRQSRELTNNIKGKVFKLPYLRLMLLELLLHNTELFDSNVKFLHAGKLRKYIPITTIEIVGVHMLRQKYSCKSHKC